jgi:hypothetical protein
MRRLHPRPFGICCPRNVGASGTEVTKVTVFDLENKFVAHIEPFAPKDVREVFSQWGNIYVLSNDGKLSCLQRKTDCNQIGYAIPQGILRLALDIAKTQQMGEESVADIHRQYGDYLYAKARLRCRNAAVPSNDWVRTTKLRHTQGIITYLLGHHGSPDGGASF